MHSFLSKLSSFLIILTVCHHTSIAEPSKPSEKPNVLLIICDDLNDFITGLGGHPQAQTPHLERFAESAVTFRHAYSNNPVCAPSRASLFTGIYSQTSVNLFWDKWYNNTILKNSKTMMEFFRENGYHVVGSGKNEHEHRREDWHEYAHKTDYGPYWFDGAARTANPWVPEPINSIGCIDGSFGPLRMDHEGQPQGAGWKLHWGKEALLNFTEGSKRDRTPDEINADWASQRLQEFARASHNDPKPFFLSVGFVRPHTPLHAPQEYFDRFPMDSLELPPHLEDDAADTHLHSVSTPSDKGYKYFRMLQEAYPDPELGVKEFLQAYLACVAAVDDCIGQVLDTLEHSSLRDNTIVIITSDHGWDMGQKEYLFKNTLWEGSARIPMYIRAPGNSATGATTLQPVSLIDLYPTLVDLCGLQGDTRKNDLGVTLDGHSLRPLLQDPSNGKWDGPEGALTMRFAGPQTKNDIHKQHWSYRTERYRYIRYNNGKEELYDHQQDPYEFKNLASFSKYKGIKAQHRNAIEAMLKASELKSKSENEPAVKDASYWKDLHFKNHPEADLNGDGTLTWKEFRTHKAANPN